MKKVRLTDEQFLSVIRAALCSKIKKDGNLDYSKPLREEAREILKAKNKSEG